MNGTLFDVQRASFHDGPGIRSTVFFKGCPLRCPWCHNPEGMAFASEVLVRAGRCLSCGSCVEVCARPGGPLPAGAVVGSDGCAACGRCARACPTGAREIAGRAWTVEEVLAEVLRDRLAYEESGGGVTFSGGEPLAQSDFLIACLDACHGAGLRTAVDTCGFAPREIVMSVAERTDLFLWDVKLLDPQRHRALTGAPLKPILANLAAVSQCGVPIWLRVPVIPGVNDDEDCIGAIVRLAVATPSVQRVSLLPYHRIGAGKRARLAHEDSLASITPPSSERMRALAALFVKTGIDTRIGG